MKIKVNIVYLDDHRFWTIDIYGPKILINKIEEKECMIASLGTRYLSNINLFYPRPNDENNS